LYQCIQVLAYRFSFRFPTEFDADRERQRTL
jgi:hypothetical protein